MQETIHTRVPQPIRREGEMRAPLRPMEEGKSMKKQSIPKMVFVVFVVLMILGIGTGYLLSRESTSVASTQVIEGSGGKAFGSTDTKAYPDTAVGTIEKDGIGGEGTHKLLREGGDSQTACVVSSTLDLDEFVGKKVKVYGATMAAKKCPWFMDVGRIELQ